MRSAGEIYTACLRTLVKHHVDQALICLILGAIASLDEAQAASRLEAPTSPAAVTQDQHIRNPAQFHEYFAADLSAEQAAIMARSQVLNAADNFKAIITTPAWRSKPSWMLVAAKTEPPTLTLNDRTPSEPLATQSKSQAQAMQFSSRIRRKSQT
jgi:hypothetical protein